MTKPDPQSRRDWKAAEPESQEIELTCAEQESISPFESESESNPESALATAPDYDQDDPSFHTHTVSQEVIGPVTSRPQAEDGSISLVERTYLGFESLMLCGAGTLVVLLCSMGALAIFSMVTRSSLLVQSLHVPSPIVMILACLVVSGLAVAIPIFSEAVAALSLMIGNFHFAKQAELLHDRFRRLIMPWRTPSFRLIDLHIFFGEDDRALKLLNELDENENSNLPLAEKSLFINRTSQWLSAHKGNTWRRRFLKSYGSQIIESRITTSLAAPGILLALAVYLVASPMFAALLFGNSFSSVPAERCLAQMSTNLEAIGGKKNENIALSEAAVALLVFGPLASSTETHLKRAVDIVLDPNNPGKSAFQNWDVEKFAVDWLVSLYVYQKRFDEAETLINRLLEKVNGTTFPLGGLFNHVSADPIRTDLYHLLAFVSYSRRDLEGADLILRTHLPVGDSPRESRNIRPLDFLADKAVTSCKLGRTEDAENVCRSILQDTDRKSLSLYKRAWLKTVATNVLVECQLRKGDPATAEQFLLRQLKYLREQKSIFGEREISIPLMCAHLFRTGSFYLERGKPEKADVFLSEWIRLQLKFSSVTPFIRASQSISDDWLFSGRAMRKSVLERYRLYLVNSHDLDKLKLVDQALLEASKP